MSSSIPDDDLALLRRHEPVLVFAADERFHPLAIEAYLGRCDLLRRTGWLRRARRVTEGAWDPRVGSEAPATKRGAARAEALGGLETDHHLRFLDPAARRAARRAAARQGDGPPPPWPGLAILFVALATWWGLGIRSWTDPLGKGLLLVMAVVALVSLYGWVGQRYGPDRAGAVALGGALLAALAAVAWTWESPVGWMRVGARLLAGVLLFAVLQGWADRTLSKRAAVGLERLSVAPIALAVGWVMASLLDRWIMAPLFDRELAVWVTAICAVVLLLVLVEDLITAFMAVFSALRREAGDQAEEIERQLRQDSEGDVYPYYGRVWRSSTGETVALQYFFFYAFNDWRRHDGLNFHEADWEWVTVFLEPQDGELAPREVAVSQHHAARALPWSRVEAAADHPVIRVAVGSHANYFTKGRRPLPDLIMVPWLRRAARALLDAREKGEQAAAEGRRQSGSRLGRAAEKQVTDRSVADDARQDGRIIGPATPKDVDGDRERGTWTPVLIDGSEPWMEYRGLWGVRTLLRNESGPPGPKWERHEKLGRRERAAGRCRELWEHPPAVRGDSSGRRSRPS